MPTLSEMIDEVRTNLQGYSLRQDRITYVNNTAGLTTTSLEIQVGSSDNLAKGLIEIDDELIWIATFNTNNTINIYENIQPGRTVQVWYTTTPNTLDANTDDYEDVTGLSGSTADVTILGACYKLLSFLDADRINLSSAEADLNDTKNPYNSGASASRYVFALYQQRLQEEALKLQDKFPIRIHYTK